VASEAEVVAVVATAREKGEDAAGAMNVLFRALSDYYEAALAAHDVADMSSTGAAVRAINMAQVHYTDLNAAVVASLDLLDTARGLLAT
jgi:hypothetical protein